jgi:glyoxylase-like metal-dependent hydrolase (beta-lactamase superfamily II)
VILDHSNPADGEMRPEIAIPSIGAIIYRIVSPLFHENTYVMIDEAYGSAIVIDPGVQCYGAVVHILNQMGCRAEYIVLTHEHYDHIGSINQLRKSYRCQVVASPIFSTNIMNAKKNLSIFYDPAGYVAEPADILVNVDGIIIPWCGCEFGVFRTPGHTEGGICAHVTDHLFTGDTIIKNERTVTKLPGGSEARLMKSIEYIFSAYSPNTVLLPGHGEFMLLSEVMAQHHHPPLALLEKVRVSAK